MKMPLRLLNIFHTAFLVTLLTLMGACKASSNSSAEPFLLCNRYSKYDVLNECLRHKYPKGLDTTLLKDHLITDGFYPISTKRGDYRPFPSFSDPNTKRLAFGWVTDKWTGTAPSPIIISFGENSDGELVWPLFRFYETSLCTPFLPISEFHECLLKHFSIESDAVYLKDYLQFEGFHRLRHLENGKRKFFMKKFKYPSSKIIKLIVNEDENGKLRGIEDG